MLIIVVWNESRQLTCYWIFGWQYLIAFRYPFLGLHKLSYLRHASRHVLKVALYFSKNKIHTHILFLFSVHLMAFETCDIWLCSIVSSNHAVWNICSRLTGLHCRMSIWIYQLVVWLQLSAVLEKEKHHLYPQCWGSSLQCQMQVLLLEEQLLMFHKFHGFSMPLWVLAFLFCSTIYFFANDLGEPIFPSVVMEACWYLW